jgi:hypothetical protein
MEPLGLGEGLALTLISGETDGTDAGEKAGSGSLPTLLLIRRMTPPIITTAPIGKIHQRFDLINLIIYIILPDDLKIATDYLKPIRRRRIGFKNQFLTIC